MHELQCSVTSNTVYQRCYIARCGSIAIKIEAYKNTLFILGVSNCEVLGVQALEHNGLTLVQRNNVKVCCVAFVRVVISDDVVFPCQASICGLLEGKIRVLLFLSRIVSIKEESQLNTVLVGGESEVTRRDGLAVHVRPAVAIPRRIFARVLDEGNFARVGEAVERRKVGDVERADDAERGILARPILNDETLERSADDNCAVGHDELSTLDGDDVAVSVCVVCLLQAPLGVGLPLEGDDFSSLAILLVKPSVPHSEDAVGCRFDFD